MLAASAEKINNVFEIVEKRFLLKDISMTFHGRDVFSPTTAYLSKGIQTIKIGKTFKNFMKLSFNESHILNNLISCEVLYIDSFGNIVTNIKQSDLPKNDINLGSCLRLRNFRFKYLLKYSDVTRGSLLGLVGSHGFFEIAMNQQSAAKRLHIKAGMKLRLQVTC